MLAVKRLLFFQISFNKRKKENNKETKEKKKKTDTEIERKKEQKSEIRDLKLVVCLNLDHIQIYCRKLLFQVNNHCDNV